MATLINAPTRRAARYGLLQTAERLTAPDTDDWVEKGLYLHDRCGGGGFTTSPECASPINAGAVGEDPCQPKPVPVIVVEYAIDANTPHFGPLRTEKDLERAARERLDLEASALIEQALTLGVDSGGNAIADTLAEAEVLNPLQAVPLLPGVGMLEQGMANRYIGAEPFIHSPRGYASELTDYIIRGSDGNRPVMRTLLGSPIAFGTGYSYTATLGLVTPSAAQGWIWATGNTGYVTSKIWYQRAVTVGENKMQAKAYAAYGIAWLCDPIAVLVDNY